MAIWRLRAKGTGMYFITLHSCLFPESLMLLHPHRLTLALSSHLHSTTPEHKHNHLLAALSTPTHPQSNHQKWDFQSRKWGKCYSYCNNPTFHLWISSSFIMTPPLFNCHEWQWTDHSFPLLNGWLLHWLVSLFVILIRDSSFLALVSLHWMANLLSIYSS